MVRREFLMTLLGGLTAVVLPQPLSAFPWTSRVAVVPLGKRARTLALARGFPVLGYDAMRANSLLLMGCFGGNTGLQEASFYSHTAARAIVLMPMPFEGRRRWKIAEAALGTLRAANMQVDIVEAPLTTSATLDEARRTREGDLITRCEEWLDNAP